MKRWNRLKIIVFISILILIVIIFSHNAITFTCDNDERCETGEDSFCPDCGNLPDCGNQVCDNEKGETISNCPKDCGGDEIAI